MNSINIDIEKDTMRRSGLTRKQVMGDSTDLPDCNKIQWV